VQEDIWVPGNHDKDTRKLIQEFSWFNDLAEVSLNGQRIVLCHYAVRVWNQSSHGAWHLYGHSHGRLPESEILPSMDVGVDTHDFSPWHFDEINVRITQKIETANEWQRGDTEFLFRSTGAHRTGIAEAISPTGWRAIFARKGFYGILPTRRSLPWRDQRFASFSRRKRTSAT
jgi:hypothetical protein